MFKLPQTVTQKAGRIALKARQSSPQGLFGLGCVGLVATAVLASRATLQLPDELDHIQTKSADFRAAQEGGAITVDEADKAIRFTYVHGTLSIAKLYTPAVVVGAASILCFGSAQYILNQRNAALVATVAGLDKAITEYRARVQNKIGVEAERDLWTTKETVTDKKTKTEEVTVTGGGSMYARLFSRDTTRRWSPQREYNQMFIRAQQNYANDLLKSRGHIFLNEVYDMLGLERSKAGSIVGWVIGNGDNMVDFGVFEGDTYSGLRFVNGDEDNVWLDFNVDGVIYDKIEGI